MHISFEFVAALTCLFALVSFELGAMESSLKKSIPVFSHFHWLYSECIANGFALRNRIGSVPTKREIASELCFCVLRLSILTGVELLMQKIENYSLSDGAKAFQGNHFRWSLFTCLETLGCSLSLPETIVTLVLQSASILSTNRRP